MLANDASVGGSSGSPIVNADGYAVAMMSAGHCENRVSWYLPLERARRVLDSLVSSVDGGVGSPSSPARGGRRGIHSRGFLGRMMQRNSPRGRRTNAKAANPAKVLKDSLKQTQRPHRLRNKTSPTEAGVAPSLALASGPVPNPFTIIPRGTLGVEFEWIRYCMGTRSTTEEDHYSRRSVRVCK